MDFVFNLKESDVAYLSTNQKEILSRIRCHQSSFSPENSNPFIISVAAAAANGNISSYSSLGSNIWITGFGGGTPSATTSDSQGFCMKAIVR